MCTVKALTVGWEAAEFISRAERAESAVKF